MAHGSSFTRVLTTPSQREALAEEILASAWSVARPCLLEALVVFLSVGLSPRSLFDLEESLRLALREFGRNLLSSLLNALEPNEAEEMPHHLMLDGGGYRRLRDKTRRSGVATLFGMIQLRRRGYRYWHAGLGEATVFPLELSLGLIEGVTPALADRIGRSMAEGGATQSRVLAHLRAEHGVAIGAERLRAITAQVSEGMGEFQLESQAEELLKALETAAQGPGKLAPVMAVGRDGITLRNRQRDRFEVASVGTVAIFDRDGKRLTTIYLAHTPEPGQTTLSAMLTALLTLVLTRWHGPPPRLAYISDSGSNECEYYESVLKPMRHPRTGEPLGWQRVADFYHAAERVWDLGTSLFGAKTPQATAWARRMLKLLKKPSGISRVLHSAAALSGLRGMSEGDWESYDVAYEYLRSRTALMRYDQYKAVHIPLGSGITEAACKTVFTQRLKLSGMRWTKEGAKSILTLRTCLLSRHWEATFSKYLDHLKPSRMAPYTPKPLQKEQIAA